MYGFNLAIVREDGKHLLVPSPNYELNGGKIPEWCRQEILNMKNPERL